MTTRSLVALATAFVVLLGGGLLFRTMGGEGAPREDQYVNTTTEPDRVVKVEMDRYRGPLPDDLSPAEYLPNYAVVALVEVEAIGSTRWNTSDGFSTDDERGEFLYSTLQARVLDGFKGTDDKTLTLAVRGGTAGGVFMDPEFELKKGDQAVVFLMPQGKNVEGLLVDNVYVVSEDGTAHSVLDQRTVALLEFAQELRTVAAAQIGTAD